MRFHPISAARVTMAAVLLLSFCFSHAQAADDDWVKSLPVKPGSTVKVMKTQRLFINRKYAFKFVDGKAWLKGAAHMTFDDDRGSSFGSGSGNDFEATFDAVNEPVFSLCKPVLQSDIPAGKQIRISGEGRYTYLKNPDEDESQEDITCKETVDAKARVSEDRNGDDAHDDNARIAEKNKVSCKRKVRSAHKIGNDILWVFEFAHLSECALAPVTSTPPATVR